MFVTTHESKEVTIISYPLIRPQANVSHQKMELGTPVCQSDHIRQRRDASFIPFFSVVLLTTTAKIQMHTKSMRSSSAAARSMTR